MYSAVVPDPDQEVTVETIESRSPAAPDEVVLRVPAASPAAVADAARRARSAAAAWQGVGPSARAAALSEAACRVERASRSLAELAVREVAKPRTEAEAEVARTVAIWRYYAQAVLEDQGSLHASPDGCSLLLDRRRPHGVVGLITPWNFPLAIPSWKAAPALAMGNAVLLKPAPQATALALALLEHLEGGLPEGLVQVLPGDASTGAALIEEVQALSFTGSVGVGAWVADRAAARGIPYQCEMGGQNASMVLPDVDPGWAARSIAQAAMGFAGQKCTATSRVVVVGDPAPFTDALVAAVEELPVGDPSHPETVIGPVIDETARQLVLDATDVARTRGARLLTGRGPARPGYLVHPVLLDAVAPGDPAAQEEVFGPFAVVLRAVDVAQAVSLVNGVRYGLVTSVYTSDLDQALALPPALHTGMVKLNAPTTGVDFWAPFGGDKASSFGLREQGKAALVFYSTTQTVTVARGVRRPDR